MLTPSYPYSLNGFSRKSGSMLDYSSAVSATSYLLDDYAQPEGAYSLRYIKSGVTNVITVRRVVSGGEDSVSDFTPTEITDGTMEAWVNAVIPSNDGFVTRWYDQSGNGNHVTQAFVGLQPQIVSSGSLITEGSLPAIDTYPSGSALYFDVGLDLQSAGFSNATAYGVYRVDDTSGILSGLWEMTGSGALPASLHPYQADGTFYPSFFSTTRPGLTSNTFTTPDAFLSWYQNLAGTLSVYANNTLAGSTSVTFADLDAICRIGAASGNTALDGNMQEIVVWGSDQSANRAAIQTAVNAHYSTY